MGRRGNSGPAASRRDWSLPLSLILFALVTSGLIAFTAVIVGTVRAERAERTLIERTDAVLAEIDAIGRAATNAETGQRGYFITLDRGYLGAYELGRASYPVALGHLRQLLARSGDPRVEALVGQVGQLADAKFAELARSVKMIEDSRIIDAHEGILSDEGERLMVRLRATLGELEGIERDRLTRASAATAALEARIMPLLAALLALVFVTLALGLWQVARAARADAQAAQAAVLAQARDRADLLARELNHRVKNLFAVILGIVRMSGRGSPEAKPVLDKVSQRIQALIKAHEVTQGASAEAAIPLERLIEIATAPYCSEQERCRTEGPPLTLPGNMAMPLGLVLHELVTNAVKYGAWSQPGGAIDIRWRRDDGRLLLDWHEPRVLAAAPAGNGGGFGTQLIASSARQLGGTIERSYGEGGLDVRMSLPLPDGAEG
jgi:two-component sensor histidine kinase